MDSVFHNASDVEAIEAGTVVFSAGEIGEEMYGILDGEVELRIGERLLATLGPGEIFGEMALINHTPHTATATVVEDASLAVIDRPHFLSLVTETPAFALDVMSVMAQRLREANAAAG